MSSFLKDLNLYIAEEDGGSEQGGYSDPFAEVDDDDNDDSELIEQQTGVFNGLDGFAYLGGSLLQTPTSIPKHTREVVGPSKAVKRQKLGNSQFKDKVDSYVKPGKRGDYYGGTSQDSAPPSKKYAPLYPSPQSFGSYRHNSSENRYLIPQSQIQNSGLSVLNLPDKFRNMFPFTHFNKMQSECFSHLFRESKNCIISSPTGSGKTVLFELAILQLYMNNRNCGVGGSKEFKVLYMAPTKALCTERYQDWSKKFTSLNLTVGLLTSDTSMTETENVRKSDVIICTAYKWDLLTRRWSDYSRLFELVDLLLVDEIHVIKDQRGSTLEVVITRMKRMCKQLRIIALSATVPNIEDISIWIRDNHTGLNEAQSLVFGEEYRAVNLNRFVYGCKNTLNNDYKFDSFLNPKVLEIIRTHFNGKPVLIFCPTRAISVSTAKYLKDNCYGLFPNLNTSSMVPIKDRDLAAIVQNGIAFHHAGLSYDDRQAVEKNFLTGVVKVLCSTSTLAVGVNLPAYLVIVKGTKSWVDGSLKEYSDLDILQMIGRAGRPQFEKEGCAVVLTDQNTKSKYERIIQGTEKLESCLHLNFAENLAAEITLRTITSVESAVDWLKSTFFFTRYIKNPSAYNEVKELRVGSYDLEQRLARFCQEKLEELLKEKIIIEENGTYKNTPYCDSMSRHYVLFETIKSFIHSNKGQNLKSVLSLFSGSYEYKDLRLKHQETKLFKEIASSPLVKFRIDSKQAMGNRDKINLIIQYELGGLEYPNYNGSLKLHSSFLNDKNYVFKQSPRIGRCMIDVFIEKKDAGSLINSLKLARCINGRCWEDTAMVLRQLQGIGLAYVRKFASHNVISLDQAKALQLGQIEYYLGMKPGSGIKIQKDLEGIPRLSVKSKFIKETISSDFSTVESTFKIEIFVNSNVSTWHGRLLVADVVTEVNNIILVDFRRIALSRIQGSKSFSLMIPLRSSSDSVKCHIFCSEIAGIRESHQLNLSMVPEWKFRKLIKPIEEEIVKEIVEPFDEFDDEFDDQEIDILLSKAPSEKLLDEVKRYQLREDGKYECNHSCKDKSNCRHMCCKEGLLKNPVSNHKGCNHSCKDKSKCRHICCRETLALQQELGRQQLISLLQEVKPRNISMLEDLHDKSGIDLQIPSVIKNRELEPAIVSTIKLKENPNRGGLRKLPVSTKKPSLFDSNSEESDDQLDMNDALELLLAKPKIGFVKDANFKIVDKNKDEEEKVMEMKGTTTKSPIIIIDDTTDPDRTVDKCIEQRVSSNEEVENEELNKANKKSSWFDDYSLDMNLVKNSDMGDNNKVQDDQESDSFLNFLGSDIEIV